MTDHLSAAAEALARAEALMSVPQVDASAVWVGIANAHLRIAEAGRPSYAGIPAPSPAPAPWTGPSFEPDRVSEAGVAVKDTYGDTPTNEVRTAHPSDGHIFEPNPDLRTRCLHCNQLPSIHEEGGLTWEEIKAL